jgi:hypothetical protein
MLCWGTEYDERIRGYAGELGVDVEIFHSSKCTSRFRSVTDPRHRPLP